jgi:hypothetical protein
MVTTSPYTRARRLDHVGHQPLQGGNVGKSEVAWAGGPLVDGGAAHGPAAGAILGRVADDDAVAYGLVEHEDERSHGVLHRRPAVVLLPLVNCSVHEAGINHRHRYVAERGNDSAPQPCGVRVVRRGRVDAASPAVADAVE